MAEYIEREKLLKAFKLKVKNPDKRYEKGMQDAIDCLIPEVLADITDADVQPVKHAIWIITDDGYCRCESCHKKAPYFGDDCVATDFCPHCGAKMDGGDSNV